MNISVDGGGLCASHNKRYGTYTFSANFIEAVKRYDTSNKYAVYTFCNSQIKDAKNIHFKILQPSVLWMKFRVPLAEYFQPQNYFLALNQAIPLVTPAKIISFSHGLSFEKYPKLYSQAEYFTSQLRDMVRRSEHIVVSSSRVKEELQDEKATVLPFGIPFDMKEHKPQRREKFLLYVGMDHPIKNLNFLTEQFARFIKIKKFHNFKLYMVGCNYISSHESIVVIPIISRKQLKKLYQTASAYVTTSLYESFNFPVIEALIQRCPVVGLKSAIIPEAQSFCTIVGTKYFIDGITQVVEKSKTIDREKLTKQFSWRVFTNGLTKLY